MSHPSLGRPPLDATAGHPAAAARIRSNASRLGARALDVALAETPGMRERYDEPRLRYLLRGAELLAERIALCVAADDTSPAREYAEWTAPLYRRSRIPMDDLIALCDGLRAALPGVLQPAEIATANAALDATVEVFRWHRRIAGDARKRNPLLQLLYKGG